MNNFKVIKTHHLKEEYALQITDLCQRTYKNTKGTYLFYPTRKMNEDNRQQYFILGILNDKVIAYCQIISYEKYENDDYIIDYEKVLISSFVVDVDYQKQGYGTKLIDTALTILEEDNINYVCVWALDTSKKIFERLGFNLQNGITSFGDTVPGDENSYYYEKTLSTHFRFTELTNEDARVLGSKMRKSLEAYKSDMPQLLKPYNYEYQKILLEKNDSENSKVLVLKNGRLIIGYISMFYEDFEEVDYSAHYVSFEIFLDGEYKTKTVIKLLLNEAKNYFAEISKEHNVEELIFNLSYSVVEKDYEFYRSILEESNFKTTDRLEYKFR